MSDGASGMLGQRAWGRVTQAIDQRSPRYPPPDRAYMHQADYAIKKKPPNLSSNGENPCASALRIACRRTINI